MLKSKIRELKKELINIGLSNKEAELMLILYKAGAQKPSDLARLSNTPRSSVVLILNSLSEKGFVHSLQVGKHLEYASIKPEEIESALLTKVEAFKSSIPLLNSLISQSRSDHKFNVELFEGETGIMQAYNKILELHKGQRIYFIQGKKSVSHKLKLNDKVILKWQNDFKKSGIIMEAIGNTSGMLEVKHKKSKDILQAHTGRLIIMYDMPHEICNFDVDVAILPDKVIIFMVGSLQAVVINSISFAEMMKSMFRGLTLISKRVNLNEEVDKLLQD